MVKKLLTMPDCTEVSTKQMVGITYDLRASDSISLCILKHPMLFLQLLFVDSFALNKEFLLKAAEIIGSCQWGITVHGV